MTSVNEALSYDRDAVGIGRKGTIDKPYKLRAPFWTVDTLFYCIPEESVDLDFLEGLFLNVDWASKDESTGLPSLSKTIISDVDILVPKLSEQVAISGTLASLDNLITLHQCTCPIFYFCAHGSRANFASTPQGQLRVLRYPRPIPKMLVSPSSPVSGVFDTIEGARGCGSSSAIASTPSPSARKNPITSPSLCCRDSLSSP